MVVMWCGGNGGNGGGVKQSKITDKNLTQEVPVRPSNQARMHAIVIIASNYITYPCLQLAAI